MQKGNTLVESDIAILHNVSYTLIKINTLKVKLTRVFQPLIETS